MMDKVEKAKISDVPDMQQLINFFAGRDEMLARPLSEIYENLRDFFVIRENGHIVGCVALHISWLDLAEIKSLAVAEGNQRQGLGTQLIQACLQEALELGLKTVFCLTYKPKAFAKSGFSVVDKMTLPRKVWTECYRCPKFPDCDEVAMVYNMK